MARNSLRTLNPEAPETGEAASQMEANHLPEDVRRLLHERETLETRMATLTGRVQEAGGDRFPVTPLPARRAADAAWAAQRDQRGSSTPDDYRMGQGDGRAAELGQADDRTISEPLERTGQRSIRALTQRTGLRGLRDLDIPTGTNPLNRALRLPETSSLRDSTTNLPKPGSPERSNALTRASERLDILRGGSGDLDELRSLAQSRRAALHEEARRLDRRGGKHSPDADRDAARLDGRGGEYRPDADRDAARLDGSGGEYSPDADRDAARLDGRGSRRRRSDDV